MQKWISPHWPCTIWDKAFIRTTRLLFSCCISFLFSIMPSQTWTSCNMPQKRLEAFFVWRFSHSRAVVFGVCGEQLWQPERERGWAQKKTKKKEPWLNTGPAPRKEREGLVCTDREELISCDIIELYINNVPEKWVVQHWLTQVAECEKTRAANYLFACCRKTGMKKRGVGIRTSGLRQHVVVNTAHKHTPTLQPFFLII